MLKLPSQAEDTPKPVMGCSRLDTLIWTSEDCAVPPPQVTPLEVLELLEELPVLDEDLEDPDEPLELDEELEDPDEPLEPDEEPEDPDEPIEPDKELEDPDEPLDAAEPWLLLKAELLVEPEEVPESAVPDDPEAPVSGGPVSGAPEPESLDPHAQQRVVATEIARKL